MQNSFKASSIISETNETKKDRSLQIFKLQSVFKIASCFLCFDSNNTDYYGYLLYEMKKGNLR